MNRPTDNSGFEVSKEGTWHVLAGASLAEKGVEGIISPSDGFVRGHLTVRLDAVLQAVQLPACIADLRAGLTDVDGDTLTLQIT